MNVVQFLPRLLLKPYVKRFLIIESEEGTVNKLLPDTSIVIAFRYKGTTYKEGITRNLLPSAAISGISKTARSVVYGKNTATLLIIFRESYAAGFFDLPMHELFSTSVSLDALVSGSEISEIIERLAMASHHKDRITVVEQFLLSKMRVRRNDAAIAHAVEAIRAAHGNINIKTLSDALYISSDPFEKRFRKITGTSPKHFASIVRMRTLVDEYARNNDTRLTDMAYKAGYFDQSHFIKDFRQLTGLPPRQFFSSGPVW